MPSQETSHRHQPALLWTLAGTDDYGQPIVSSTATELMVRWEQQRQEITDSQGNTVVVDATAVVAQRIEVGAEMWLAPDPTTGALEQWLGTGSGGNDSEVMKVALYDEVADVKGRAIWRQVGLQRKGDTPSRA